MRLAAIAAVLSALGGLRAGPPPATAPVDAETAEAYKRFRQRVLRQAGRMAERMTRRYGLDDDQGAEAREMIVRRTEAFLGRHGPAAFAMFRRGRAVAELMREEQMTWDELPADIRRDLARQGITLMERVRKELLDFADAFAGTLNDEQRERFAAERARMQRQFDRAVAMARVAAGQGGEGERRRPEGPGARTRPAVARRREADRWERYVGEFIRRHRLDAVQERRALDLLAEFRRELASAPASRPAATRPTSRAAGATAPDAAFEGRLAAVRVRRQRGRELFAQLKRALDTIPTPAQRRLAEEDAPPGPETKPPAGGRRQEDRPE